MKKQEKNLLNACINNDFKLVQELLNEGKDPNQQFEMGATALMIATQEGNEDIVSYLLSKGANPNISAENNVTPLLIAAAKGNTNISQILVSAGAKTSYDEKNIKH